MHVMIFNFNATFQAATETGESSSVVTDEITNNDVTPHDYLTTSSSILPVKLQTISFTSHEGTTPEDSALFSSAATGRTTGGGTGPSVTHQSVEGKQLNDSFDLVISLVTFRYMA